MAAGHVANVLVEGLLPAFSINCQWADVVWSKVQENFLHGWTGRR